MFQLFLFSSIIIACFMAIFLSYLFGFYLLDILLLIFLSVILLIILELYLRIQHSNDLGHNKIQKIFNENFRELLDYIGSSKKEFNDIIKRDINELKSEIDEQFEGIVFEINKDISGLETNIDKINNLLKEINLKIQKNNKNKS